MAKELRLGIGGIVLALASIDDGSGFEVEEAYAPFVSDGEAQVMLRVHRRTALEEGAGEKVFDSGGKWRLYRDQNGWAIHIGSPGVSPRPYQIAILEPGFLSGDIHIKSRRSNGDLLPFPLAYPLAEVLMMNLLALGRGALVHACGISDRGRGLLFVGASGAGKSTLAELWKDQGAISILSDDRVIVREKEGRFWAYGTPWHGDAEVSSREGVPLEAVFLIRHGEKNAIRPLEEGPRLVSSLLVCSFPTYWSAEGMAFTLGFLDRMSRAVPCYELGFLPDKRVVEFVLSNT